MLVHTGDNQATGHYLCYNIIGKQYLQIISDKNVYFQTFKEGKSAIETNGYLFFVVKLHRAHLGMFPKVIVRTAQKLAFL